MIPKDKIYHAIAGALITLTTYLFGLVIGIDLLKVAFVMPILGGIAKELYDKYHKKTYFDLADLGATIFGGWLMVAIIYEFLI